MKLNYRVYGSGQKHLVILHGLLGSLDNWQTLARRWSEHYTVVVPDLRNHGRSPHSEEMDYEVMSGDILELADDLGIDRLYLLGHSMGGKVAMTFALKYAERLSGLIVADIAPIPYPDNHSFIFDAMRKLPLDVLNDRSEADELMAEAIPSFPVRQFILKNLNRENGRYVWKLNLDVIESHYEEIMDFPSTGSYDGPVLFIKGDESNYVRESDWPVCLSFFPKAELKDILEAGHWLHADQPDIIYREVCEFIG